MSEYIYNVHVLADGDIEIGAVGGGLENDADSDSSLNEGDGVTQTSKSLETIIFLKKVLENRRFIEVLGNNYLVLLRKEAAFTRIQEYLILAGYEKRALSALQKKLANLKAAFKKKHALGLQAYRGTGGGPSPKKPKISEKDFLLDAIINKIDYEGLMDKYGGDAVSVFF